jgi:hypothetical protein
MMGSPWQKYPFLPSVGPVASPLVEVALRIDAAQLALGLVHTGGICVRSLCVAAPTRLPVLDLSSWLVGKERKAASKDSDTEAPPDLTPARPTEVLPAAA